MVWLALLLALAALGLRFVGRSMPREGFSPIGPLSVVLAIAAAVVVLLASVAVVPAGHVGVVLIFGRVEARPLHEGLNFVNPVATVAHMSVRTETYTMSSVHDEGAVKGDDAIQTLSADGLLMPLDITVVYRLIPPGAPWLYRNIGPDYVDKVIRPAARTAVREAAAGFTAQESYSTRREELATRMSELLTTRLRSLLARPDDAASGAAFVVEQVMIRNVQLPPKVKDAIEEKLQAEQQALRMQFVLQKERQEAERKRIEGQGIADFQRIVAEGISERLLAWKGIEATEQLANSPNTKVVVIGNAKNGMPLILPTAAD